MIGFAWFELQRERYERRRRRARQKPREPVAPDVPVACGILAAFVFLVWLLSTTPFIPAAACIVGFLVGAVAALE